MPFVYMPFVYRNNALTSKKAFRATNLPGKRVPEHLL